MTWFAQTSAVFWPLLLNHLWQATLFAIAAAFAVWMLRTSRAQARYLILLIALLRFALPAGVVTWGAEQAGISIVSGIADAGSPAMTLPAAGFSREIVDPIVSPVGLAPAGDTAGSLYAALTSIWLLGVAFILARWSRRKRAFAFTIRSAHAVTAGPLAAALDRAAARLDIHGVQAVVSESIAQPGVLGVWRPVIVLPAGIETSLNEPELQAVLSHELLHVRRRDNLVSYLQALICAAVWFHPVVWWLDRRLLAEREAACDEGVMDSGASARDYVSGVLKVCRFSMQAPMAGVSRMSESRLRGRMERVMSIKFGGFGWRERGGVAVVASAAVISWLAIGWMGITPLGAAEPDKYERWLSEDVVYVISPAEKALFEKVTTDQQRDALMQKFWLDRDPTPGTPENEFHDEHYRRIAYANERWGIDTPGWKTDRGRILIVHGPPDEIEVHPSEGREQWMYRSGILENVILDFVRYEEAQKRIQQKGQAGEERGTRQGQLQGVEQGVREGAKSGSRQGTEEATKEQTKQRMKEAVRAGLREGVVDGVGQGIAAGVELGIRDGIREIVRAAVSAGAEAPQRNSTEK